MIELQKSYQEKEVENESLRSKRLTARNEIIKMAQALEKAQKEGHELKNMFQFAFLPIVSEHVSSIESILMQLESSTNKLAAKSSVKIKQRTKKAFGSSKHRRESGTEDVLMEGMSHFDRDEVDVGESTGRSIPMSLVAPLGLIPPPISTTESKPEAHVVDLSDVVSPVSGSSDPRPLPPITPRLDRSAAAQLVSSPLQKSSILESAHSMRNSLDKISSGLTLLNDSVEKLHSIIQLDTGNWFSCCRLGPSVQYGDDIGDDVPSTPLEVVVGWLGGLFARGNNRSNGRSNRRGYVTVSNDSTSL